MAITDGGIHHLLRPALVGEAQRIVAVGEAARRTGQTPSSVVGPLCTGLDVLAAEVSLPEPRIGRPAGRAGHGRLRLHGVDAPVPVPPDAGGGRRVGWHRARGAAAPGAGIGVVGVGLVGAAAYPARNASAAIVTGACRMRDRSAIDGGTRTPYVDVDRNDGSKNGRRDSNPSPETHRPAGRRALRRSATDIDSCPPRANVGLPDPPAGSPTIFFAQGATDASEMHRSVSRP